MNINYWFGLAPRGDFGFVGRARALAERDDRRGRNILIAMANLPADAAKRDEKIEKVMEVIRQTAGVDMIRGVFTLGGAPAVFFPEGMMGPFICKPQREVLLPLH